MVKAFKKKKDQMVNAKNSSIEMLNLYSGKKTLFLLALGLMISQIAFGQASINPTATSGCVGQQVTYNLSYSGQVYQSDWTVTPTSAGTVTVVSTTQAKVTWTASGSVKVGFAYYSNGQPVSYPSEPSVSFSIIGNAGTISGPSIVEYGSGFTLSAGSGVTYQKCVSGCSTTNDTGWSTTSSSITNFTQKTKFRKKLNNTSCGVKYSNIIEVDVYPQFSAGSISIPSSLCSATPVTISSNLGASGGNGAIYYQWQYHNGSGWSDYQVSGSDQASLSNVSMNNPTFRRFRRKAWSNFNENLYSNEVNLDNISVSQALDAGSLLTQDVCYNNFPGLITGSAPTGGGGGYTYTWEFSNDGVIWSTPASGGASFNYETQYPQSNALVSDLHVRRNVFASGCGESSSATVVINALPLYTAGVTSTSPSEFAYGGGSLTLSNMGSVGGGVTFQKCETGCSTINDTGWTNLSGNTDNIATTTKFRAKLNDTSCGVEYSNTIEVVVYPEFIVGTISIPSSACSATPITISSGLEASGGKGTIQYQWEYHNGSGWTDYLLAGSDQALLTNISTSDPTFRRFRRKAWSNFNENLYSNEVNLDDITLSTALDPGSLLPQDVCYNTFPELIIGSTPTGGGGGYTYTWEFSNDGVSWSTPASGGASFNYETEYPQTAPLINDLYVRRNVSSSCNATSSSEVLLTVLPQNDAGTLTVSTSESAYGGSVTLTSTGVTGGTTTFQSCSSDCSLVDNTGWHTVSGTVSNLTTTAKFRVKLDNEDCGFKFSNILEVVVYPKFNAGSVGRILSSTVTLFSDVDAFGGKGAISYQWERYNGTAWTEYPGTDSNQKILFNVSATDLTYRKFRRRAWSEFNESDQYSNEIDLDAPDDIYNYVKETYVIEEGLTEIADLATTNPANLRESGSYFDELGRPMLTVQKQASPAGYDMLNYIAYDDFGRQTKVYLPYSAHLTAATDGFFDPVAREAQEAFFDDHFSAAASNFSFSETVYEASPLNRPLKTYAPGQPWANPLDESGVSTGGGDKPVTFDYSSNLTNEVIHWEIENDQLKKLSSYEAGTLYKNITTDENGMQVQEFKNIQGQVILKKVQRSATVTTNDDDWLQTYYIYDDFGNLRFVLPPMGTKHYLTDGQYVPDGTPLITEDANFEDVAGPDQKVAFLVPATITVNQGTTLNEGADIYSVTAATDNFVLNQSFVDTWTFQYRYDKRQRMIEKRVPGAGWVHMVYDARDRLVMTQDGNQRANDQWLFTKYDQLDRPVLTGLIVKTGSTRSSVQTEVDAVTGSGLYESYTGTGTLLGYDGTGYPATAVEADVLTVTYYDNYDFADPAHSYWTLGDYTAENQARTFVTGSKVKAGTAWNETVTLYDSRYRVTSTVSKDYQGDKDTFVNTYRNLVHDRLDQTVHTHESQLTSETIEVTRDFLYDHADRLLKITHTLDVTSDPNFTAVSQVTVENEYNELGELRTRKLNEEAANQYSQEVDYQYNIRGWLTKINDPATSDPAKYFAMDLKYDVAGQYNGNIGEIDWKNPFETATNSYAYSYDPVNRIESAAYSTTGTNGMDFDVSNITYDANGNILTLQRTGNHDSQAAQLFDDLDYGYVGNQLTKVTDASGKDTGFKDGANVTNEYVYDANGNMIEDKNKGIDSIAYNHLNLPIKVEMNADGSNRIEYIYDAAGIKMAQLVYGADTLTKRTDYQGAFIYEDSVLQFIQHEEGRVIPTQEGSFDYQYHLKDHLGNVRATFKTEIDTDIYSTTLESDSASTEELYFYNLDSVRVTYASANKTPLGDEAARVGQDSLHSVGPAIALSVVPGDTVSMEVWAYYEGGTGYANTIAPETFIATLAGAFGGSSGAGGESGTIFEGVNEAINGGAGGLGSNTDTNVPGAYLSYILFDQNYKEIQSGYHEISDAASYAHEKLFLNDITISQAGYLYIYTSMQSKGTQPVYFDDMKVTHTHSPIVSKDDYYPFGLTFNSYQRAASTGQNYKYSSKERISDLGIGWDDFGWRMYDQTIGRWNAQDIYSAAYRDMSPYAYVANNPVVFVDQDGLFKIPIHRMITQSALKKSGLKNISFTGDLLMGNTMVADVVGGNSDFHFDGRKNFSEIINTWERLQDNINIASVNTGNGGRDVVELGILLHTVQDFYAHSNYIELYKKYMMEVWGDVPSSLEIPTILEVIANPAYSDFVDVYLKKELLTGEFHLAAYLSPFHSDIEKTNQEGNVHHDQLAKDSPDKHGHSSAVDVATRHTTNILLMIDTTSSNSSGDSSKKKKKKKKKVKFNPFRA